MASSSVKAGGERATASSFAVTCNLLSQFIKEKGRSLADLGLGVAPAAGRNDTYRPPTTMSLLPGVDVSGEEAREHVPERNATKSMGFFPQRAGFGLHTPPAAESREPDKSQLTIFYGGKVLVFDNFPAEKAKDLLMIADKGCGVAPPSTKPSAAAATEPKIPSSSISTNFLPVTSKSPAPAQACPPRPHVVSDLPIARKASLHRFLEKRKDRINAKAPYQMNKAKESPTPLVTPKLEEDETWLGLKPSLSSQCSR